MSKRVNRYLVVVPFLILAACTSDEKASDTALQSDDGEPSSTSDSGEEPEPEPVEYNIEGSIEYDYALDGSSVCDATIGFSGTPYTGSCYGCDFAFSVSASFTAENSTEACDYETLWTMLDPEDATTNFYMMFFERYDGYYGYTYDDVMFVGYDYYYPGYGSYVYWSMMTYDYGYYYGEADFSGSGLDWSYSSEGTTAELNPDNWDLCSDDWPASVDTGLSASESVTGQGELGCPEGYEDSFVDVWSFSGTEGETVTVTVDTTSDETAGDLAMWINDPDGCVLFTADDEIECSYPPPDYACPATQFEVSQSGTYSVVVHAYGSCAGDTVNYQVGIDGVSEAGLEQITDNDAKYLEEQDYVFNVGGSSTLTPVD